MSKCIKIETDPNIKYNNKLINFLNPDYIYVPIKGDYKLKIKNHNYVSLNDVLLENDKNIIYSSVSGIVEGLSDMIVDGKTMKTIVIENDFKEKSNLKGIKKNISNYTKEELNNLLISLGGFKGKLSGNTLVVSGIDLEPYEKNMSYLISSHADKILETIDVLIKILDIHKCFFAIKNNDALNVTSLISQIGTYPNIDLKLLNDLYPIGYKDILIDELVLPAKKESGVIFLTVEDVYNIYHILKRNKPVNEKLVTFSGNLLKKSSIINCKIGSRIGDIIENNLDLLSDKYYIVINGLLSGYEVKSLNTIITRNIRSVFITDIDKSKKYHCINCGECVKYCPVNANPKTGYNMDKCIKCGVCNYLCPAKINLLGDKHE